MSRLPDTRDVVLDQWAVEIPHLWEWIMEDLMPATSERQRRYLAAVLARLRAGKRRKGDPKMSTAQLRDFVKKPKKRKK